LSLIIDFSVNKHCFVSTGLLNNVAQLFMSVHDLVCRLLIQSDQEVHCQFSKHEPLPPPPSPLLDDVVDVVLG
jgi:hypothetical protein|tara:strand:+ start:12642 stop:12860 length:219 start_codon:yes stop_codon:yes gene_type:complete